MSMDDAKRKRLKRAGWVVGDARDFLGLSEAEAAIVEIRAGLAIALRRGRIARGLSQTALAARIGSSQSRVAKMEAGDPTVSLDLLIRSLLATGSKRGEIAASILA